MKREQLSDQLRQAILAAPMTRYRMAKTLGIHAATLSRLVNGKRGLPLELIDDNGELLGLRLVVDGNPAATTEPARDERPSKNAKPAKNSDKKQARPAAGKRKGG